MSVQKYRLIVKFETCILLQTQIIWVSYKFVSLVMNMLKTRKLDICFITEKYFQVNVQFSSPSLSELNVELRQTIMLNDYNGGVFNEAICLRIVSRGGL
jgi:hypothetical protein